MTGSARASGGLGTFGGVFTPSILTILGLILFLRLGFVIGHGGAPAARVPRLGSRHAFPVRDHGGSRRGAGILLRRCDSELRRCAARGQLSAFVFVPLRIEGMRLSEETPVEVAEADTETDALPTTNA
jgi:hypothetical protein